jgi:hypothetical protein
MEATGILRKLPEEFQRRCWKPMENTGRKVLLILDLIINNCYTMECSGNGLEISIYRSHSPS